MSSDGLSAGMNQVDGGAVRRYANVRRGSVERESAIRNFAIRTQNVDCHVLRLSSRTARGIQGGADEHTSARIIRNTSGNDIKEHGSRNTGPGRLERIRNALPFEGDSAKETSRLSILSPDVDSRKLALDIDGSSHHRAVFRFCSPYRIGYTQSVSRLSIQAVLSDRIQTSRQCVRRRSRACRVE
jgi:hypothetical protein